MCRGLKFYNDPQEAKGDGGVSAKISEINESDSRRIELAQITSL